MTDRIAEQGAVQHAVANASTEPVSRLGAAGWIQGKIKDNASAGRTNPSTRASAAGRLQYQASQTFALNLDFTTGTLDSRITFTRATTATYYNSSGVLSTAASGAARFDYDPSTLVAKGLLIEEARTNLCKQSEDLTVTPWDVASPSVVRTSNVYVGPDGATTMDELKTSAATGQFYIATSGYISTSAAAYTLTAYVKYVSNQWIVFWYDDGTTVFKASFDVLNGVTGLTSGVTSSNITQISSGVYRIQMVFTAAVGAAGAIYIGMNNADSVSIVSWTGTGAEKVGVWGAQLEAGAFPTSYIPTTSAAVTRNADVAVMTGTNFSDWFNATEGTFYVEADCPGVAAVAFILDANNGGATETIKTYLATTSLIYKVVTASTTQVNITAATITANTAFKIAYCYKLDDFAISFNGGASSTDTLGTPPTVNKLGIGNSSSDSYLNGHIKSIKFFNTRKSNADLVSLTA